MRDQQQCILSGGVHLRHRSRESAFEGYVLASLLSRRILVYPNI